MAGGGAVQEIQRLPTGIEGFDLVTGGGLPQGRTTLVAGSAGSAKTVLAIQFLVNGIARFDSNGVFVTFEEPPDDIRRNAASLGWSLEPFERDGRLLIVDMSPDPEAPILVAGRYDLSAMIARIEHAVTRAKATRVAIDSVSAFLSHFDDMAVVRQELLRLVARLKALGVTVLLTGERIEGSADISRFGVEEFVADSVVILRNTLADERRRRTLEVLKLRGAHHQKGEFPFTISGEGVEVIPLSAMELTQHSAMIRISSGSPELDTMLGGGFYRDSIILASGATGTGKTLLVTHFLNEGAKRNEKVLLFAFEESREQLLRNAIAWGMDFRAWEEQGLLRIVCAYPEILGLEDHLIRMRGEIVDYGPARIAVDSLSALERVSTGRSFREFIIGLTSTVKERETPGLFTATTSTLMGGGSVTEHHISTITDTILLMRYVELMGEMRRGITVLKMRGSTHDTFIREYKIDGEGMHIGKPFRNVGGIIAGTPTQAVATETHRLSGMFEDGQEG